MSRGDLQEMEVKTQQSSTAVNSGAAKGDPMPTTPNYVPDGQGAVEDLGALHLRTRSLMTTVTCLRHQLVLLSKLRM